MLALTMSIETVRQLQPFCQINYGQKNIQGYKVKVQSEHRSKLTHALLQTGGLYCGCLAHFWGIFVSRKDGIRLMRRKLLPRSDGPLSSY